MKLNFKAINQVVADAIQEEKNAFSAYDLGKAHAALGKKPENLQTPNTKSHAEYEKGYKTGMSLKGYNESEELSEANIEGKIADWQVELRGESRPEERTKIQNRIKTLQSQLQKKAPIKESEELSEAKDAKKESKPAAAPDEDGAEVEAQSKSKALEFERTHVPSGKTTLSKFNKSHHWILGTGESEGETPEDDYSTEPEKSRMKEAKKLVDKWNTISPDTWKYKLKSKSVNESEDDTLDEAKDTKKAPDESDENEFMKKDAKKFKSVAEGIMRRVVDKMDLAEPNTPYKKIIKDVVKDTASGIKDDTKAMINVAGKKSVEGWEYVKSNLQHLKQK